jgi:hypothetical protein
MNLNYRLSTPSFHEKSQGSVANGPISRFEVEHRESSPTLSFHRDFTPESDISFGSTKQVHWEAYSLKSLTQTSRQIIFPKWDSICLFLPCFSDFLPYYYSIRCCRPISCPSPPLSRSPSMSNFMGSHTGMERISIIGRNLNVE